MSDDKKKPILLRINIAGYKGSPVTLYGAYDPGTDVLAVMKQAKEYEGGPNDRFLKLTNQDRDKSYDGLFKDEDIREAIMTFFGLKALKLLNLGGDMTRVDPEHHIEKDGIDEGGQKYRFHPDMNNTEVAVLAACHFAGTQRGVQAVEEFNDALMDIDTV